jgi:hypothetical protein
VNVASDATFGDARRIAIPAAVLAMVIALGTLQSGANAPAPSVTVSPSTNLHDGETVSVSVGVNGLFTPNAHVNILECADPGGKAANLPKDIGGCDGNTIQADTVLIAANGSFSEKSYTVFVLPSSTLGEQSNHQPVCNQTNPCVLYVGQNQNDFTAPKVFSAPFTIGGSTGGVAPSSTTSTSPTPSVPTTAAAGTLANSGNPLASSASSLSGEPTSLAETGAPADAIWIVIVGLAFFLTGWVGRRLTLRARA